MQEQKFKLGQRVFVIAGDGQGVFGTVKGARITPIVPDMIVYDLEEVPYGGIFQTNLIDASVIPSGSDKRYVLSQELDRAFFGRGETREHNPPQILFSGGSEAVLMWLVDRVNEYSDDAGSVLSLEDSNLVLTAVSEEEGGSEV